MNIRQILVIATLLSSAYAADSEDAGKIVDNSSGKKQAYDIAAYFWPAYQFKDERWNSLFEGGKQGEWEIIRNCKPRFEGHRQPRVPLWGYEDESELAVMEKKIEAAASHGVNVFVFDWYWYEGKPFLENTLNEAFLKAKNHDQMKFYLMWANHEGGGGCGWSNLASMKNTRWPGTVNRETFDQLVDRWIEKYMKQPSYYKIDGKPVFSIYEVSTLMRGLGGLEKTKEALDYLKSKVKAAGFPGLHLQGILWGKFPASMSQVPGDKNKTQNATIAALGIDSLTNYQYVHLSDPNTDYDTWAGRVTKDWDAWSEKFSVPYFPHVSIDWDTNPRRDTRTPCVSGACPEAFKKYLLKAKAYADAHPKQPKLITINSWNEWSEGSYLEPDTEHGMGYLEAVRDVFLLHKAGTGSK